MVEILRTTIVHKIPVMAMKDCKIRIKPRSSHNCPSLAWFSHKSFSISWEIFMKKLYVSAEREVRVVQAQDPLLLRPWNPEAVTLAHECRGASVQYVRIL